MAMQNTDVTQSWAQLVSSVDYLLLQAAGDVLVNISATAPVEGAPGFLINSGDPYAFTDVSGLGGCVWIKSVKSTGAGVTYAAA